MVGHRRHVFLLGKVLLLRFTAGHMCYDTISLGKIYLRGGWVHFWSLFTTVLCVSGDRWSLSKDLLATLFYSIKEYMGQECFLVTRIPAFLLLAVATGRGTKFTKLDLQRANFSLLLHDLDR